VAGDDWRLRIELEDRVDSFVERLGFDLHDEARELAEGLAGSRLAVTRDHDTVFVYADTAAQGEDARQVVESVLDKEGLTARTLRLEHWLHEEERWDDEPAAPTWEEEALAHGHAPWEVRVECTSREEADSLADELEGEGYKPVRSWRYLIVGASSREEADELAKRIHGRVEAGGEIVWEAMPQNPFAVFGGLGG
jgi:hypothetical protein